MDKIVKNTTDNLKCEEKSKAAELARLIALLPEQEQAKIYYMLKGFEIFGKNPEKSTA